MFGRMENHIMGRINELYRQLLEHEATFEQGITASKVSEKLQIDRSTASRYLNELVKRNQLIKLPGKPVKFLLNKESESHDFDSVDIGQSIQPILQKSMAALLYPATSMPILITGETGTGKTHLAETLATIINKRKKNNTKIPFIAFNCADYAQNAELLVGQIFGIAQGAFTGAVEDRTGLVDQADGGILFLDEIHRLPPSGQEMLFYLMDKGIYRRLGEATIERKARVTLIGATTKDPNEALLPTLLRRFSLKLTIPPLRERTREEREELVRKFLTEEASKMKTDVVITEQTREVFLTYECPGNIGQLKSDIQIACARAYLRYLNEKEKHVTIKLEDLPREMKVGIIEKTTSQIPLPKVPLDNVNTQMSVMPNIYQELQEHNKNNNPNKSKEIIQNYIHELSKKYRKPETSTNTWSDLINEELLEALKTAYKSLKNHAPIPVDMKQLHMIGLHLQNYRHYKRKAVTNDSLPSLIHPNVSYRQTAKLLANILKEEIDLQLPPEEIELIAHFLTPEESKDMLQTRPIAILLVTHGNSTASSMAQVTNTLLGNTVIHAIDMPLEVSAEETYKRVKERINGFYGIDGVLILVDIGSLITMGDAIRHDVDVPIKTLSSVNLPMVLEAGRKSMQSDITLDEVYESTKTAMMLFVKEDTEKDAHRRMIVTVCFTGEGAAPLLESWIKEQLSGLDEDVLVRTVRIDPSTKDTTVINDLKNYYDIIAIVGTVPITIEGIPYIPAWELLQQEGISRINKLLEVTRKSLDLTIPKEIKREEISDLIMKGLSEIITYVNPKTITGLLKEYIPPIREFYQWDSARELGMWMHIGSLIDRLISAVIKGNVEQLVASIPIEREAEITMQEQMIWSPFFSALESTFHIEIPENIKKELVNLSR